MTGAVTSAPSLLLSSSIPDVVLATIKASSSASAHVDENVTSSSSSSSSSSTSAAAAAGTTGIGGQEEHGEDGMIIPLSESTNALLEPLYSDPSLPSLPPQHLLHAIVQAALYIVVFRAAELRTLAGGVDFLCSLQWPRMLGSPLDPLSHCSEAVAREFARVALALRLITRSTLVKSSAFARLTTQQATTTTST